MADHLRFGRSAHRRRMGEAGCVARRGFLVKPFAREGKRHIPPWVHQLVAPTDGIEHWWITTRLPLFRLQDCGSAFGQTPLATEVVESPLRERDRSIGRKIF